MFDVLYFRCGHDLFKNMKCQLPHKTCSWFAHVLHVCIDMRTDSYDFPIISILFVILTLSSSKRKEAVRKEINRYEKIGNEQCNNSIGWKIGSYM